MPNMSPNVQKNAQDWVRDLRFSNQVNMQTMGVDTDRVTPQLLLASSNKLLSISKGQQEGDPKDSLQFQRFYGPVEYFAERIQKDGGSVARSMLWKATNRGSVDFIGPGSLEPHVNAVFHESNLSQFVDNSSVMESVDTSQKVTRIGEGGVSDEDSVPIEMRLVQPSYYGYIDGVRCYSEDTEIYTKEGWISVKDMTEQTEFATLINGKPQWSKPTSVTRYEYHGKMYGYDSQDVQYLVSPQHKMWVQRETTKRVNGKRTKVWGEFKKLPVEKIHEKFCRVLSAIDVPMEVDETQKWFYLPPVESSKSGQKILKNIEKVDIIDFAAFMGWYLSEGCYSIRQNWPANKGMQYVVHIAQSPKLHPEYYEEIRELIERLPFGAHPQKAAEKKAGMALTIHRKQLCLYCKQFGNSFEKFIPEWIFTAPTKARWAFVDAILKGDGSEQRHLNTVSKRLAQDFARLLFELGQSVRITKQHQSYISTVTGKQAEDIYTVVWHKTQKLQLWPSTRKHRPKSGRGFFTEDYNGYIYCPSVPGGLVYVRRKDASFGIWLSNTAEKSPGVTGFLTKNLQKGTDGKLYQTFINMHTGKPELVDSQKAARSVVTTDEYLNSNDEYVYALGGPKGVRIVKRQDVDYILPNSDDAWSMSSNTVPMLSGIKAMRLLMGCHHPETPITVIDSNGMTHIVPAKRLASMENIFVFGCNEQGIDCIYPVRKVVTRVPAKKAKFKKIVLSSGRTLLTSAEHKWWIFDKQFHLLQAKDLEEGMKVPRSMFSTMPVIRTAILGAPITPQICTLMGRIIRSLKATNYSYRVTFIRDKESGIDQKKDIEEALKQLNVQGWNIFSSRGMHAVSIKDPVFQDWIDNNIGKDPEERRIPSELLSLPTGYTSVFLDSYYKDLEEVGENPEGDIWLLNIANPSLRDQLSFMLSKLYTDTIYRDFTKKGKVTRALELVPVSDTLNDIVLETIVKVLDVPAPAVMIDIDCDDHVYAAANGIITHNSKYVSQAVPLQEREAPLVRGLDQASGMDMATKVGKLLGTQWAPKAGMVKAVRDDRIDMVYDDGTTGSVYLYKDLPANAKGWLTNYPKVKAGDKVAEGQLLATSNYTDDNGLLGVGRNLRVGYLSYKGGTYEDGGTISESAAKKLGYTTMYKTDMDKDKSIRTAKHLYVTWKPGQYTKEQLDNIDDEGVVKVGATVNKGDPVILGIRTTEPSPGTLGKRILSDVTEVWEHAHPGVVTDVVNGKNGIKVFAKISAPLEAGDKISGFYGNKMTIAKVLPDDQMPTDAKGRPLEVLFDPLGIVSRCYDSQTEFLTKRGWKKGAEITDKDQLWSFDPKTWKCSWSKQLQTLYKKHYRGLMYGYEGKLANFLVTPGHKVWSKARKGEWEQQQIQDIYNQESYIPIVADPQKEAKATPFKLPTVSVKKHDSATKNEPIEFAPEDFASFLGWYLSQGHYTIDDHGYNTFISQDGDIYPDKCWKIYQLLKRMKLSYSYSNSGKRFRIYGKRLTKYVQQFGKCDQKFIPDWLFKQPSHVKQCFVDALLMGDGKVFTKHKNGKDYTTSAICLTSEILIDQLQALLATMGIASTKHYDGPDKRYPDSKPMWRLGITTIHRQVRNLRDGWYQKFYDGIVYCPTVKTGYVLTRRNGCLACLGNTNPSQLMEVGLGKVAQKIGQPIVVPAFQPKGQSRLQFVKDMMKKYNVPWKEDCKDPETGRTIKNVYTGVCYYIPLKHIADTKMSARGTAKYSADEVPLGGGEEGCFPAMQGILTDKGQMSIGEICNNKLSVRVLSWDKEQQKWVYNKVTDWFHRKAKPGNMLHIKVKKPSGQIIHIFPTDNHIMYMYNGEEKEAGQLKEGDLLSGTADNGTAAYEVISISRGINEESSPVSIIDDVYDITVEGTHNYVLSGGVRVSNSKRLGMLENAALVGHNAFNFLQEAKLIRGQANSDFWRSLRTGQIPVMPGEPLAHKKFFAHLQASGLNVQRNAEGVKIFALSNKDVNQMAGPRELKTTDTYSQKSFQPIDGGLFGQDVFGIDGDKWGYIQLDNPLPNPVMEEPLARLLNISDREFQAIAAGKGTVKGMKDAADMKKVLSKMNLQREANKALLEFKQTSKSNKDKALKRYVAIARMRDQGVRPQEYMLDRIPVLPPKFRPITSHGDLTMVADSNYLYSQLLNARDDLRDAVAAGLPQEYQQQGKANLYSKWKELVGLYDPSDVKLKAKDVKGLLKWAMGKSPKFSAFQQKVLGSTVDTVGRGVVIPSTKIKLNQIGMPVEMAWKLYSPFITRKLTQQGYSPIDAMQLIKEHKPVAMQALLEQVKDRPVVMNRAPSLHKLSLMGFNVKLTNGHAIKVNPSIVVPYGMDFDGDSIWNTVWTVIDREEAKGVFDDSSKKQDLTNQETGCILSKKASKVDCQLIERLDNMFGKETSARLLQCNMALSEIPHKEGTEVHKSETVTEWEPGINVYLPTIDPATGEMTIGKMTKISRHTGLKMFDCTLSVSGAYSHVVTASEDHSLITLNPSTLELEKTRPEDARGRCVPRVFGTYANHWEYCAKYIQLDKQYPLSYEMGVFLGTMIGDGWVDSNGYSFIACCDKSFQDYIIKNFAPSASMPFTKEAKLFRYAADEQRFSQDDKQRFSIYMDHKAHWALKEKIGSGAYNKKIPWECLLASKAHMIGILVGLLATDGHIGLSKTASKKAVIKNIAYHTTSGLLRDGIQELCMRLGVKTRVTPYMGVNSKVTCYSIGFCLEDIAKLKREHADLFILPVEHKEEALKSICADIYKGVKNSYDIVPFPRGLFCEFSWAKVADVAKATVIPARAKGYIKRDTALKIADKLEGCQWQYYETPPYLKKEDRTNHTPEEARTLVDKWISIVRNDEIGWEIVDDVTPSTCTEGWDCTVPGPYTFALSTGTIVQDTVNIHVPVSKKAVEDVRQKMMPERNLIGIRDYKVLYKPQKAYVQGLYVATRIGETKDVKVFPSQAEATKAYKRGQIDIDTPIVIKEKQS